jgi:hypothetical protein
MVVVIAEYGCVLQSLETKDCARRHQNERTGRGFLAQHFRCYLTLPLVTRRPTCLIVPILLSAKLHTYGNSHPGFTCSFTFDSHIHVLFILLNRAPSPLTTAGAARFKMTSAESS